MATVIYIKMIMVSSNPMTSSPLTAYASRSNLVRSLLKALFAVYHVYFPTDKYSLYALSFFTFAYFCILVVRVRTPPEPLYVTSALQTGLDALLFIVSLSTLIIIVYERGSSPDNLSIIYLLLFIILTGFFVYFGENTRLHNLLEKDLYKLDNEEDVNKFFYSFILVLNQATDEKSILQLHYLMKIQLDRLMREESLAESQMEVLRSLLTDELKPQEYKTKCFEVINAMIDGMLPMCSKGGYLRIMKASILNLKLGNKWEAIYQTDLILNEDTSSSWAVSLAAVSILKSIEHDILEAELRDGQNTGINVVKTVELQKSVASLHEKISENTEHVLSFWSLLLNDVVPARKFELKGIKITELNFSIRQLFDEILKQNSNHLQTLLLYGNYLDSVMNEQEEAERILSKANSIKSSLQTNQMMVRETRMRLFNNINPCIIIASANRKSMGIIKSANTECAKVLGWSSEELVGKGLETLMPKVYGDHHLTYSSLISDG